MFDLTLVRSRSRVVIIVVFVGVVLLLSIVLIMLRMECSTVRCTDRMLLLCVVVGVPAHGDVVDVDDHGDVAGAI